MSDRIYLQDVSVPCRVGISAAERRKPQEVLVSVSLYLDLSRAGLSDSPADTPDYRLVRETLASTAQRGSFRLLEGLAESLASALLGSFGAGRVVVNVKKSKYSRDPAIGVEIERKAGSVD